MSEYVGMTEISHMLGVCELTIRNWIAKDKMPSPAIVTARGWRLWNKSDIHELARQRAEDKKENEVKA